MELDFRDHEEIFNWSQVRSEMMASVAKMVGIPTPRLSPYRHYVNVNIDFTSHKTFKDTLT
tara:strand:- start:1719 stop:1901 length:183 start_codon:yes stop_codon:yes gene_type:complete